MSAEESKLKTKKRARKTARRNISSNQIANIANLVAEQIKAPSIITSITFGELFQLYFDNHVKTRLRNSKNARWFISSHGTRWSDVAVHKITRRDVQDYLDAYGKKSPAAATKAVNMMSAIINWGIAREYVPNIDNPCKNIEKFRQEPRKRFLGSSEFVAFKNALDQEAPLFHDLFWVKLLTGARRANILAMSWDEIDFDLAIWTIPDEKFKTGSGHVIPLSQPALHILKRRKLLSSSPWVFPGKKPGQPIGCIKRPMERILKRAEITNFHVHDLRRSLASYMAMRGESQNVIAKMLGHGDLRSTSVYARLDLKAVRAAAEAVSNDWLELVSVPVGSSAASLEAPAIVERDETQIKTSVSFADQIIVEAKILTTLKHGVNNKKGFYGKIGTQVKVDAPELERILSEMQTRNLIVKTQTDAGAFVYALVS